MDNPIIGKVLAGKYRIDGFLKKGGMGAVYRGTHLMLGKSVAIKLIKPELVTSEDTVQRFQLEARAASHLSHRNIVTIHDLGQAEDGTLYIAMELVDGKSLKQVVLEQGALDPDRAVRIAKAIAGALALAHRENVIHRDLKPQNIMMTRDSDGREKPILLDFGIAKTFESDRPAITSTGMVLGTPQYMSPEQAGGKSVNGRSDLYALGIILYEMLAGKVPFDDPSIPAVLVKHLSELPKPPSSLRTGIPPSLEQIVLRCLDKVPEKRFSNAEELLDALSAVGETVTPGEGGPTVGIPALIPPSSGPSHVQKTTISPVPPPPLPPSVPQTPLEEATVQSNQKGQAKKASNRGLWLALGLVAVGVLAVGVAVIVLVGGQDDPPLVGGDAPPSAASVASPVTIPSEPSPGSPLSARSDTAPPERPQSQEAAATPPSRDAEEPGEEPTRIVPPTSPAPSAPATPPTTLSPPKSVERPPTSVEPIPAQPSVDLTCQGVSDACASLRAALEASFDRAGIAIAYPERAEVLVTIFAEEVEARQESQFGTLFVVRTYSIEIAGESPRFGERVSMPPPEMVTFDSRFGADKLAEHSRKVAGAVTEKILDYWSRKK